MPNLGDINMQSIAGAIGTATHGTGAGHGNIATVVVGMEIVTGDGSICRTDEDNDPELLTVARVGLGALGIVTEVTLRCVPMFNLQAVETIEPLADLLADFERVMHATDHVEFYWMPGARRCQVKRNTFDRDARRTAVQARLHPRQVDRRKPGLWHRVPGGSALSQGSSPDRQVDHVCCVRT